VSYLHGLSSGDFAPALEQFLGTGAGLSASAITRLTSQWQHEARAFAERDLSGTDYVYLWVDGIHLKVRLDQEKLCLLVMIGVRADGRKELVALTDGYRESTESWADPLRGCRRRGMTAPVLAVGDGALGFWKVLRGVFPGTREQRCWCISKPMCLPRCRSRRIRARSQGCGRSSTPKTSIARGSRSRRSRSTMPRSIRKRSPRSSMTPRR
jgi:transposase-like protein